MWHIQGRPVERERWVNATHAAVLEATVEQLYEVDHHRGGASVREAAATQLERARNLLHHSRYTERVGRRLQIVVGELAVCAGWLAFDAGDQAQARYLYTEALTAARIADHTELEAHVLANMSLQATTLDHGREGLRLASRAQELLAGTGSPLVRSLLAVREARAAAHLGDGVHATAAMLRAHRLFGQHRGDAPVWMQFFDDAELAGNEGMCQLALGKPRAAVRLLEYAHTRRRPEMVRNGLLYTARLASAHLAAGNVDRACDLASDTLVSPVGGRLAGEVHAFYQRLGGYRESTSARRFAIRYHATMP